MSSQIFCTQKQLQKLTGKIADEISIIASKSGPVVVLGILNGCIPLMADVMMKVRGDVEFDTIRYKSYNGIFSKGKVRCTKKPELDLKGRTVIILDDIVESGDTMRKVVKDIFKHKPDAILTAALFKRSGCELKVSILGKVAPKGWWLYGYGLDNDQLDRNLPIVKYKKS